jgi:hypothetical protein
MTKTKKMRVLETAKKEFNAMCRRAQVNREKNQGFDDAVCVRWDISETGNIKFAGWLKESGTWYTEYRTGFAVTFNYEYNKCEILSDYPDEYKDIQQSIINELWAIENEY